LKFKFTGQHVNIMYQHLQLPLTENIALQRN